MSVRVVRKGLASLFSERGCRGTARTLTLLLLVAPCAAFAPAASAADSCPNAALRVGPSAALPDCRAYELVTPDLNHASLGSGPAGQATRDGQAFVYQTIDAPDTASSASVFNIIRADRDAARGWRGASLSMPLRAPVTAYTSITPMALSPDLSASLEGTDQPLTGPNVPSGKNIFVRRSDGSYRLVTTVGAPLNFLQVYEVSSFVGGNDDFSQIYFQPAVAQLPSDPLAGNNTYAWSEAKGLRLIGILPDGTPAPSGATYAGSSSDGRYVAFVTDGRLYLRVDDAQTVEIGASQRTVDPDLNPAVAPSVVSVASDGSKVLMTSRSELTNDANTGETNGAANDAGRDLYSYDTRTGVLTDLTVATNPSDTATGANVQFVLAATPDHSFIYFTATGALADGAEPGHVYLYVWHDGRIEIVTQLDHLYGADLNGGPTFSMTPDGRHVVFASIDPLTGFDNTDPVTGAPHVEVFKATYGSGVECASCRVDGTRPTDDSFVPRYAGLPPGGRIRVVSDDGRRVFFHSRDAVVPHKTNGKQQVFEYANGRPWPISGINGTSDAVFLDASASGDDAFFATYDDLLEAPNGGDQAVFDARVGGGLATASQPACAGVACRGSAPPAPAPVKAGSVAFFDADPSATPSTPKRAAKVVVSPLRTVAGSVGSLKVKVPGKGRLTVSGADVQTRRLSLSKARTITVRLALTRKAARTLSRRRSLRTKVKVAFTPVDGKVSSVTLPLTFRAKAGAAQKGLRP